MELAAVDPVAVAAAACAKSSDSSSGQPSWIPTSMPDRNASPAPALPFTNPGGSDRLGRHTGSSSRAHAIAVGAGAVTVTGRSVSEGSLDLGLGQPPRDIVTVRYARAGAMPAPRAGGCARRAAG